MRLQELAAAYALAGIEPEDVFLKFHGLSKLDEGYGRTATALTAVITTLAFSSGSQASTGFGDWLSGTYPLVTQQLLTSSRVSLSQRHEIRFVAERVEALRQFGEAQATEDDFISNYCHIYNNKAITPQHKVHACCQPVQINAMYR